MEDMSNLYKTRVSKTFLKSFQLNRTSFQLLYLTCPPSGIR
jgi:hypothetical protein